MDELDYYNFIRIDRNKKDAKSSSFLLKVELAELKGELLNLRNRNLEE